MDKNKEDLHIVKLRSISNEIELAMIKEILEDNKIPYLVKDHGMGGYMRIFAGVSAFGTDVMVKQEDFDQANSLLESISIE